MIRFENVSKNFGKLQALQQINLQCESGECIALVGPNGCGKTTLFKSILGLVIPDKGNIYFHEKSILNAFEYRSEIGYMPQVGKYPENLNIGQLINLIKKIRNNGALIDDELYHSYRLESMNDKSVRVLSGGTIQKVSAAIAFMFNPSLLILDEPTAGLDPLAAEILKEKIRKEQSKGKLIIISSHLLSELDEMATQIIYMQDGAIKYHKNIADLKEITGESKLSKAITSLLKQDIYA
jgi:Cu-processing system ATP-binding protein